LIAINKKICVSYDLCYFTPRMKLKKTQENWSKNKDPKKVQDFLECEFKHWIILYIGDSN